jgi:hypothetical protein
MKKKMKHLIVDIVVRNLKHKKEQHFMKMYIVKANVFLKKMDAIDVVDPGIMKIHVMQELM